MLVRALMGRMSDKNVIGDQVGIQQIGFIKATRSACLKFSMVNSKMTTFFGHVKVHHFCKPST